ncbi:MAG TPA: hypothetical protein VGJ20_27910 [Xanthobacteraceae bacterium]|jgi:multidrug efflux pump subunit AcrA (membrane-fusion protein)
MIETNARLTEIALNCGFSDQAVIALPAQATDGAQAVRLPGEVHARYEMPLSFRVAAQLAVRLARLGDPVRRGQVLAKLDDSDPIKTASVARAAMHAAEERLASATRQRDPDESQMKQNLISQLQLEQTHDAYAASFAARDQAKDSVVFAQNQLRHAMLIADHDGAITAEHAQVGQVVQPGSRSLTLLGRASAMSTWMCRKTA